MPSVAENISKYNIINNSVKKKPVDINIFSNVNVNFAEELFENQILKNLLKPKINFFNIQETTELHSIGKKKDFSIIFWEIYNILNTSIKKTKIMNKIELENIVYKVQNQIDFFLNKIIHNKIVIFNLFTNTYFKDDKLLFNRTKIIANRLNKFLKKLEKKYKNLYLIDTDYYLLKKNYDLRSYNKTKSIYNINFFLNYSKIISPIIASLQGKVKKVLVLDCDNTIWKGIAGENKVQFSKTHKIGKHYYRVQKKIKFLSKNGAIICLCSKNNFKDVNKIIKSNHSEILKNSDITIKKINWENKVANIKEISKELNLDLSSFIFLDDSDFELDLIRKYLPQVLCIQVPKNIKKYSEVFFEIENYFSKFIFPVRNKTIEYKKFIKVEKRKKNFVNIDDYIKSLQIKIYSNLNSKKYIKRMSQMCLKTNQFNFTTKRYTPKKIEEMIDNEMYDLHAFQVKDIFGDNGITGLAIIKKNDKKIILDTFLMSCRIIGRKVENSILKYIINKYKNIYEEIESQYIPTDKNGHIKDYFLNNYFKIANKSSTNIKFRADLNSRKFSEINTFSPVYDVK